MRGRAVAVIGGARVLDEAVLDLAERLGRGIRAAGWHLVCGGMTGVMEAACRGFQSVGGPGRAVGILPTAGREDGNRWLDVALPTGMGYTRNSLVVQGGDAVVVVGGESGTLSEIALAWQLGCPIAALVPAGGFGAELAGRRLDGRRDDEIVAVASVEEALAWLARVLGGGRAAAADELAAWLGRAQRELGCSEASLRCDCDNLETVYLVLRQGQIVATDRGETCAYLERDEAYRIERDGIEQHCARHGAALVPGAPDEHPRIECAAAEAPSAAQAVARVAAAVDAVFAAALRR